MRKESPAGYRYRQQIENDAGDKAGNMNTSLDIRVFEGNADAVGKSTVFCTHIIDYVLSGGEIARVIPEGSEFDLTLKTEPTSSIPVLVRLSFLSLDMEFDLTIPRRHRTFRLV